MVLALSEILYLCVTQEQFYGLENVSRASIGIVLKSNRVTFQFWINSPCNGRPHYKINWPVFGPIPLLRSKSDYLRVPKIIFARFSSGARCVQSDFF